MRKFPFSAALQALAIVLLLGLVGACSRQDDLKKTTSETSTVPAAYDLTFSCEKDNQYDFDGATVDKETIRGHIRYLDDVGRTVHAILLKAGEKQKVTNDHIVALSSIARDLKFDVYVMDNNGRLGIVKIVDDAK
jgi:hypothetical protein